MPKIENLAMTQAKKIVLQETATAFGTTADAIAAKTCSNVALSAAALILLAINLEETFILDIFGEDQQWLDKQKAMADVITRNPNYQTALDQSQSALMVASMGGDTLFPEFTASPALPGNVPAAGPANPPEPATPPQPLTVVVSAGNVADAVLEKALEYFGLSRDAIVSGKSPDERAARAKTVKAMRESGASNKEILITFGQKPTYVAWVYGQIKLVGPRDRDIAKLKVELTSAAPVSTPAQPERNGDDQDKPSSAASNDDLSEVVIAAVTLALNIDRQELLTGTSRSTSKARAICVQVMQLANVLPEKVCEVFARSKTWAYQAVRKLGKGDVRKANTIFEQINSQAASAVKVKPQAAHRPHAPHIPAAAPPATAQTEQKPGVVPGGEFQNIAEKVFRTLCTPSLLFAPDPVADIAQARDLVIYLASGKVDMNAIVAASGSSEGEVHQAIGRVVMGARHNPSFAKKLRSVH